MTIFASMSMLIYLIILIFLPTLLISLLVYPHYKTLSVESKRKWIKEWGNGRVFKGLIIGVVLLCIPTIIEVVRYMDYRSFFCFNNLICIVVQILIIGFILAVYKMWISLITPEPDKDPTESEGKDYATLAS